MLFSNMSFSYMNNTIRLWHCLTPADPYTLLHYKLKTHLQISAFCNQSTINHYSLISCCRYEKFQSSEGGTRYATAAYATVYRYYAYPRHSRPRISQVLTLPPFRKLGICANLLEVLSCLYCSYLVL